MTYEEAIDRVSRRLRDYPRNTWQENEIRDYLNDGYREFTRLTHCLKKHGQTIISVDTSLYNVPSDNIIIYRAEWDGRVCAIYTTQEMDKLYGGYDWRNTEGEDVLSIIHDGEGYPQIRTYPIITDANQIGHLVTGTDSNSYRCIVGHTSASANKPITGADYADYWETYNGLGTDGTWATATEYYKYLELELDYIYLPAELPIIVDGTDSKRYECILDHTSAAADTPITGANYATYWSEYTGDKDGSTWVTGTVYAGYIYDIPVIYHQALVEYAVSQCQFAEVQSQKKAYSSDVHYERYMKMVRACKSESMRGFTIDKTSHIYGREFL